MSKIKKVICSKGALKGPVDWMSHSASETQALGFRLAQSILKQGPIKDSGALVLGLRGDLGSGKTTFLQGLALGLGVKERVTSPTFIIMRRHQLKGSMFHNFYHLDCYRLHDERDVFDLGWLEIINNPYNIVAVEWPERIKAALPSRAQELIFQHQSEQERGIFLR